MKYLACDGDLTIVNDNPSCSGDWVVQAVMVSDVDPELLSFAFGGGVILYFTFYSAFFGFKMLLRAIRSY
jgi:hypothetical protein